MSTYSTLDAVRLTGISQPMLNYLCRVGVVVPTASRRQGKKGHGHERRYSFRDLVSFKVVRQLTASGVSPVKVKAAIRDLHALGIALHKLPCSHVVIFGSSVYRWNGVDDIYRLVDGQRAFGFVLDLTAIHDELAADIAAMAA